MENNQGWVKIHRKITQKGWYLNSYYVHLWVHIIFKANHEEKEFMWNGALHKTKRGEFITGRNALVKETGIPATTIERILDLFEKEGQIGQQKNNKFRLIIINNYEKYQQNGQQTDNKRTSNGHLTDTNKNEKNEKNEKKREVAFTPPSLEEVSKYCLERRNKVDPQQFIDFYASKGWLIGKNKMKDWRAAVRTWEGRDKKEIEASRPVVHNFNKH